MHILPAIDLLDGKAVRLKQVRYDEIHDLFGLISPAVARASPRTRNVFMSSTSQGRRLDDPCRVQPFARSRGERQRNRFSAAVACAHVKRSRLTWRSEHNASCSVPRR